MKPLESISKNPAFGFVDSNNKKIAGNWKGKILGYVPLLALFKGIPRIFNALKSDGNKSYKFRHISRGIIESSGLGFTLIIPDITVTACRIFFGKKTKDPHLNLIAENTNELKIDDDNPVKRQKNIHISGNDLENINKKFYGNALTQDDLDKLKQFKMKGSDNARNPLVQENREIKPPKPVNIEPKQAVAAPHLQPIGLANPRRDERCSINVTLQMIIHTPHLKNELKKNAIFTQFFLDYDEAQREGKVFEASSELIQELKQLTGSPLAGNTDIIFDIFTPLLATTNYDGLKRQNESGQPFQDKIFSPGGAGNVSLQKAVNINLHENPCTEIPDNLIIHNYYTDREGIAQLTIKDIYGNQADFECTFCCYNTLSDGAGRSHWVALSKVNGQWFEIDDGEVKAVNETYAKKRLAQNPTLLNYQRTV